MSVRRVATGAPTGTRVPVGLLATNRLEQLYRVNAPVGAPPNLGDDLVEHIALMSANVYESINKADEVFEKQFYSADGYDAITHLCASLQFITSWRKTNKQANALWKQHMDSIMVRLQKFLDKVRYWRINNPGDMNDRDIRIKIVGMCDNLDALYDDNRGEKMPLQPQPPEMSRERAFSRGL